MALGETYTCSFEVPVGATDGGDHVNRVVVTAHDDEGAAVSQSDTRRLRIEPADPPLGSGQLQVSLSDNDVAADGRAFSYELAVFNLTGELLDDVAVRLTLPGGLRFGQSQGVAFPDGCAPLDSAKSTVAVASCSIGRGAWRWSIPVELDGQSTTSQTLVATATVTWDGEDFEDQEPTGLAGSGPEVVDNFNSATAQAVWLGLLGLALLAIVWLSVSWIRRGRTATRSWELRHVL
jgi:hypothetical protein